LGGRIEQHSRGIVFSTRNRRPLKLIYYEACLNNEDALRREKYLKSGNGKRYIQNHLKHFFQKQHDNNIQRAIGIIRSQKC